MAGFIEARPNAPNEVGRYAAELLTGKLKAVESRFSVASKADTQNRAVH